MDDHPPFFDVGGDRVRLLRDGRQAFPAMLAAIRAAEHDIVLEMYWFEADKIGTAFRDALIERARAGVAVRVSYDAVGSIRTDASFFRPLIDAGGEVHEFRPISPFRRRFELGRITFRDHRKILVVDGAVGFTGGLNIGDEWAPPEQGGGGWRDDVFEIRGKAAEDLRLLFYVTWRRVGREPPKGTRRFAPHPERNVLVLANHLARNRAYGLRRTYVTAIRRARQRIDLMSPYFLPNATFLTALRRARRRGVEVRILVPEHGDVLVVSMAMTVMMVRLIEAGARVFAFQGAQMHGKTALFDDEMATTGSFNLDMRSWRYNRECNLAVYDATFVAHVRASFESDLAHAVELSIKSWHARATWYRLFAWIVYLFRQLL